MIGLRRKESPGGDLGRLRARLADAQLELEAAESTVVLAEQEEGELGALSCDEFLGTISADEHARRRAEVELRVVQARRDRDRLREVVEIGTARVREGEKEIEEQTRNGLRERIAAAEAEADQHRAALQALESRITELGDQLDDVGQNEPSRTDVSFYADRVGLYRTAIRPTLPRRMQRAVDAEIRARESMPRRSSRASAYPRWPDGDGPDTINPIAPLR